MANLKDIVATLAILSAGTLTVTGCEKSDADASNAPDGGDAAAEGEGSCSGDKGEGSCSGDKAEGEGFVLRRQGRGRGFVLRRRRRWRRGGCRGRGRRLLLGRHLSPHPFDRVEPGVIASGSHFFRGRSFSGSDELM